VEEDPFPQTSGIGIQSRVSREGTEPPVRKALQYAIAKQRGRSPWCNKGKHHESSPEGAFGMGYALRERRVWGGVA